MVGGISGIKRVAAVSALVVLTALGACGTTEDVKPARRLFSPNGEPLNGGVLGLPSCEDALSKWFDRIDADHNGFIEEKEFMADARRQFQIMDLNHDGTITPAELATYRAPYGIARKRKKAESEEAKGFRDEVPMNPGRRNDPDLLADFSDPVMIADAHFRNVVSETDFLTYERRNFAELNTARNGRLSRAELLHSCETE